jgi:hypothetical protein
MRVVIMTVGALGYTGSNNDRESCDGSNEDVGEDVGDTHSILFTYA